MGSDAMILVFLNVAFQASFFNSLFSPHAIWGHPRLEGQGRESDKMWSTGERNGKPLQFSCLENPMNGMKRQKDRTLKDKLPRWVDVQYATVDQWRNNSRKNEVMEPKQNQHPLADVTGNRSKV